MRMYAQRLLSKFVRKQQSPLQLLASMGIVMALHHGFRHENRALHRRVFQAQIIRLLDQRPEVRNGLPSVLFTNFDFGQVYFGEKDLLPVLAACSWLQRLIVKGMSSLEISLIEECVALDS